MKRSIVRTEDVLDVVRVPPREHRWTWNPPPPPRCECGLPRREGPDGRPWRGVAGVCRCPGWGEPYRTLARCYEAFVDAPYASTAREHEITFWAVAAERPL